MALDPDKYEDDEDGFQREIVGEWVQEKHARLARYVSISRATRRKYLGPRKGGATFIDLYCGPGRARIEGTQEVVDGSPVVAWRKSIEGEAHIRAPFTQVHIADSEAALVTAAKTRLARLGAPVLSESLPAVEAVDRVIAKLNPYGLHFAFLDPYNLEAVPFATIRKLTALKHIDILVHVSVMDLQRNLRKYMAQEHSPIDDFAPGWREYIGGTRNQLIIRGKILEHWARLLKAEGVRTAETHEKVTGPKNQPLYWLAFAARHPLPLHFWEQVRDLGPERQLELGL
jgi:three-Cys-motif partner protein